MTDVDTPVTLTPRDQLGKGLNAMRAQGSVPAVIHNHGQDSIHVAGTEGDLLKIYRQAGKHHPVNLEVEKDKYLALIKDAQFDPVKRKLQHIVFQAIKTDEKVEAEIPIRIEGDAPAVKVGLIILHQLDSVEVEALPKNLPDELVVSAEKLVELHDKITVADITVPTGVTILTEVEHPIATVAETRAQVAEEAETEVVEDEEAAGESSESGESKEASEQ